MAKAKTAKPDGNGQILDIPHEEVNQLPGKTIPANVPPEEQARLEIRKFNFADAAIDQLKKEYGELSISGLEDKEGYKLVREAWGEVRAKRTGLEKKGKELRDGYNFIQKAIIKEEDRLIGLLKPLEDNLFQKWKAIDAEKERIENEKKAAEEARLMERLEKLQKLGMTLSDGFWQIGGTVSVDVATLRAMGEEQFLKLKAATKAKSDELEAEREKVRQEQKRREEEQEALRLRLQKEREELEEQRAAMEKEKAELAREREEAEKKIFALRVNRLEGLGMLRGASGLFFTLKAGEVSVFYDAIKEYSKDGFQEFFEEISGQIKELKNLQAQKEADEKLLLDRQREKEKFIADKLEAAGLRFNYSKKAFEFKNEAGQLEAHFHTFENFDQATIEDWAANAKEVIDQYKSEFAKLEKERAEEAEKERQAGMNDAELFSDLMGMTRVLRESFVKFKLKTKIFQRRRDEIVVTLDNILAEFAK